jgi:hypothetical protein
MYPPGGEFFSLLSLSVTGWFAHSRNLHRHLRWNDQGHVWVRRQEGREWQGRVVIDDRFSSFLLLFTHTHTHSLSLYSDMSLMRDEQ